MAIYTTPSGTFDFSFDQSFPGYKNLFPSTGGTFDFSFDTHFNTRRTVKGSILGNTFQLSGRNYSIRHHQVPTLKRTIRRLSAMQIFRDNISRYQGTAPSERATWEAEKINYPRVHSDGTLRTPNRYHLFISSNQNWNYSNFANKDIIGTFSTGAIFNLTSASVNYATETANFDFDPAIVPLGFNLQLYVARPLSIGSRALARARPRLTRIFESGESTAVNSWLDFIAAWPSPPKPVGYIISVAAFLVPEFTGQKKSQSSLFGSVVG